jgi:hypothetical protein
MNREGNLTKRVQTPHGWRYCPVVLSANGRVKTDLVIVSRKQETHKEGAYYLEWREGSKRVRLSVGKDPADASARRQRKEAELNAVNNGVSVVPDGQNRYRSVAAAVADFLDETKLTKKPKTLAAYSTALAYFVESCHKLKNGLEKEFEPPIPWSISMATARNGHITWIHLLFFCSGFPALIYQIVWQRALFPFMGSILSRSRSWSAVSCWVWDSEV